MPTAEESTPANKNRFEALQELDDQDPEAAATVEEMLETDAGQETEAPAAEEVPEVRTPPGTAEDPMPETLGSKNDPIDLGGKTSAQVGLASLVPSTEETSYSEEFSAPSPPLTKGRKTNKECREKEAASNINSGSQRKLDPFIKGHSSPPI